MGETINFRRMTLRYNGLFDFDGLFTLVMDWAKNYGYMWHEETYKHKVPTPFGTEQELKWIITKDVTEYVHYEIVFNIHVWEHLEVEVDVDGKKKTLSNAKIYIWIDPKMKLDWQGQFKGSALKKKLSSWYYKIYQKEFESGFGDTIWYRCLNLHALLKKFFDMQTQKYNYKDYLKEA